MAGYVKALHTKISTPKELIDKHPDLHAQGKFPDGLYEFYPQGYDGGPRKVYCDMTTDGGGWMLVARTHPTTVNYNGTNWGFLGEQIGDVEDFTQAYQCGWNFWKDHASFSSMLLGNRKNINTNEWGSHIYKWGNIAYDDHIAGDEYQKNNASSNDLPYHTWGVVQNDTNVYGHSGVYYMGQTIGYFPTATNSNTYHFRDLAGGAGSYGLKPLQYKTAHCTSILTYAGPFCNDGTVDSDGNFTGDLAENSVEYSGNLFGGTNQCMLFVR